MLGPQAPVLRRSAMVMHDNSERLFGRRRQVITGLKVDQWLHFNFYSGFADERDNVTAERPTLI